MENPQIQMERSSHFEREMLYLSQNRTSCKSMQETVQRMWQGRTFCQSLSGEYVESRSD